MAGRDAHGGGCLAGSSPPPPLRLLPVTLTLTIRVERADEGRARNETVPVVPTQCADSTVGTLAALGTHLCVHRSAAIHNLP